MTVSSESSTMMTVRTHLRRRRCLPSARTATVAIDMAAAAAASTFVSGHAAEADGERHELATFDRLNTCTTRTRQNPAAEWNGCDDRALRRSVGGLTEDNALFEARRCLSCGNCFECDNCFGVCPDNAVIKLGPSQRYEIDYDFCKGLASASKSVPVGHRHVPERI